MAKKRLKIYIAGPYTNNSENIKIKNVTTVIDAAIKIYYKGHFPYVPHLTHFVDKRVKEIRRSLNWKDYMEWHKPWLKVCDAFIYLGGSKGADLELKEAKKEGKKIFYSLKEIPYTKKRR